MTSSSSIRVRRSAERGRVQFGWLDARHTFSFGSYYDPAHVSFSDLRVINEDRVQPSSGFAPHGHRDMEIVTFVMAGALSHADSTGGRGVIRPGDVQVMSAGRGVQHSEMNESPTEPVHLLQIWLLPAAEGTPPRYDQRHFGTDDGVRLLVSPDGRDGSLTIGQDTDLYRVALRSGQAHTHTMRLKRAWLQVVRGQVDVDGTALETGDGAAVEGAAALALSARSDVELLLFDLR